MNWRTRLGPLYGLAVSLQFFTRIPMPRDLDPTADDFARSSQWIPVVGLIIGALLAAAAMLLAQTPLVPGARVFLLLALGALLTGGFHEDGLADTFDGLGGGWSTDQKLEIMRDSRIGTYGALALVLMIGLRAGALWGSDPGAWPTMLILSHVLGRWSTLPLLRALPYVRSSDAGAGKPLVESTQSWQVLAGTAFAMFVCIFLAPWSGILAIAAVAATTAVCALFLRAQIGGITGDTLGGVNVICEIVVLTLFALTHPATLSPWVSS